MRHLRSAYQTMAHSMEKLWLTPWKSDNVPRNRPTCATRLCLLWACLSLVRLRPPRELTMPPRFPKFVRGNSTERLSHCLFAQNFCEKFLDQAAVGVWPPNVLTPSLRGPAVRACWRRCAGAGQRSRSRVLCQFYMWQLYIRGPCCRSTTTCAKRIAPCAPDGPQLCAPCCASRSILYRWRGRSATRVRRRFGPTCSGAKTKGQADAVCWRPS
jgi:hypothetical protein